MSSLKHLGVFVSALLAGTAAMAAPVSTNISACVNSTTGAVRIVASTSLCAGGETGMSWALVGPVGPTGPQGPAGANGPSGPAGPTGAHGGTGATGPQGLIGNTGVAGAQGPPGLGGAPGATGPQGPAGATGPPGSYGTGAAPTGIPLSIGGNTGSSIYMRLGGGAESNTVNGLVTTYTNGSCVPKLTIWSYTGTAETWIILAVTPTGSADWSILGFFSSLNCDTAATLGSSCTVNLSGSFGTPYYLALSNSSLNAAGGGGIMQSFSCEP
jgi:hypothetical protein